MRIGIFVTARMGSTRLSNKHFRKIAGRPALSWLIDRISAEFGKEIGGGLALYILLQAMLSAMLNLKF